MLKINKIIILWFFASVAIGLFSFVALQKSFRIQCANTLSCSESLSYLIDNSSNGTYNGVSINPPQIDLSFAEPVLGSQTSNKEKHIYVDLSTQVLKAYEGEELIFETKISSGKYYPTPTGEFTIWKKIRATKMEGGEGNEYYYLPNVPYVMFFSNDKVAPGLGFGLHGAYWHNNFGHAMSHGCVNLRIIDAKKIYDWVGPLTMGADTSATEDNPGTKITIYGETK